MSRNAGKGAASNGMRFPLLDGPRGVRRPTAMPITKRAGPPVGERRSGSSPEQGGAAGVKMAPAMAVPNPEPGQSTMRRPGFKRR